MFPFVPMPFYCLFRTCLAIFLIAPFFLPFSTQCVLQRWSTKQKEMKLKQQTKDVSSSGSSGPFDLNTPRCPLHQQKYNLLGTKIDKSIFGMYWILNYNTNHMSHFYTWVVESNCMLCLCYLIHKKGNK